MSVVAEVVRGLRVLGRTLGGGDLRCVFTAAGLFCGVRVRNLFSRVLVLLGEEYVFAVDAVLLGELHQVQLEAVYVDVVVLVGECVFNHEQLDGFVAVDFVEFADGLFPVFEAGDGCSVFGGRARECQHAGCDSEEFLVSEGEGGNGFVQAVAGLEQELEENLVGFSTGLEAVA